MYNTMISRILLSLAIYTWGGPALAQNIEPLPSLSALEAAPPASEAPKKGEVEGVAASDTDTALPAPNSGADQADGLVDAEPVVGNAAGALADLGTTDEFMVPHQARLAFQAAVDALASGNHALAGEQLAKVKSLLPEGHWLLATVSRLGELAGRDLSMRRAVEDESVASLYITMTFYGFYTGVWLFGILAELDAQAVVPLSVVTAAIGFGAAYMLDHRDRPLTGAVADGISAGLFLGAVEAMLLIGAVNPEDLDGQLAFSLVWGSALAGSIIGGYVTSATEASRGDVALATAGYTWGGVLGLCAAMTVGVDSEDIFSVLAGGTAVGFGAGLALASQYDMSASRVLYINLGGIGGALVGTGIAVGGAFDSIEAVGATLGLTYLAGLVVGGYLTRDVDLSETTVAMRTAPTLLASLDPSRPPVPGMAVELTW